MISLFKTRVIGSFSVVLLSVQCVLFAAVGPGDTVHCSVFDSAGGLWQCTFDEANDAKYCASGGLGGFHVDDWVMYKDVDFGDGFSFLYVFYSCQMCGCLFSFRTDNRTSGNLILANEAQRLRALPSGGWKGGAIHRVPVDRTITGVHDLYIQGGMCGGADPGGVGIIAIKWFVLSNNKDGYCFYDDIIPPYFQIPQVTEIHAAGSVQAKNDFSADKHGITISMHLSGNHTIDVFKTDGSLVERMHATGPGTVSISAVSFTSGIYVIRSIMPDNTCREFLFIKK
ncbi:MAG: hypothetical protein GF350_16435 [Chitinivibrionales bacterium]|nr:hypothetical protein [Chitinivibrionales bacterium]